MRRGLDLGCPFSRSPKRLAASPPVLHDGGAAIGPPPQGEGSPPLEPLRRTPQRRARPRSSIISLLGPGSSAIDHPRFPGGRYFMLYQVSPAKSRSCPPR
jgi:hypothetical protein